MSIMLSEESALGRLGRQVLQHALAIAGIGIPLLSVLVFLNARIEGSVDSALIAVLTWTLVFPLLWLLRKRLPLAVVATLFLAFLGLTTFIIFAKGGLTTSSGAIPVLIIVLSGLFFGRVGSFLALLAALFLLGVAGVGIIHGWLPQLNLAMWDPYSSQTWVRAAVALGVFGGGMAMAVTYVFECMQQENDVLQQALLREASERNAKEQAEAERELARRALEESHRLESLGRLAGGVAHDFNNVLTVIMGSTELAMQEKGLDDRVRHFLAEILRASQHSAALTQELLLFSRRDISAPQVFDLGDFLHRMAGTLKRVIPGDIKLTIDLGAPGACVRLVPVNLERVMLNLVANARDAIVGAGSIHIAIGLQGTEIVTLSISDSGCGLDESTRQRMFEPFFTTKQLGRGSGLGLTLVQSLVIDAGGSVTVESAPGNGTTITLMLPRVLDEEPMPASREKRPVKHAADIGHGRTIFVVDDQLSVLATITACLEQCGFEVLTSSHGDEALRVVHDHAMHFDLMCLDGVIPGASSAVILAAMQVQRPEVPVLLCSGYVDEELLLRGIQVGELTCVRKPFHPSELVTAIMQKLGPASH